MAPERSGPLGESHVTLALLCHPERYQSLDQQPSRVDTELETAGVLHRGCRIAKRLQEAQLVCTRHDGGGTSVVQQLGELGPHGVLVISRRWSRKSVLPANVHSMSLGPSNAFSQRRARPWSKRSLSSSRQNASIKCAGTGSLIVSPPGSVRIAVSFRPCLRSSTSPVRLSRKRSGVTRPWTTDSPSPHVASIRRSSAPFTGFRVNSTPETSASTSRWT